MANTCCGTRAMRLTAGSCISLLCAILLQGCSVNVPRHTIGNWEAKDAYLTTYQFTPPGKDTKSILNSCSDSTISTSLQCSGHGRCKAWHDFVPGSNASAPRLSFCECDRDWADPECKTARKSQVTAFLLSLFLGVFGADQFYLGFPWYGVLKLLTLGGAGLLYLYDLCRIGSSPVATQYNFRVAADLPHFAFVLIVVTAMGFLGFVIAIRSIQQQRVKKAHELLLLRMEQQEVEDEEREAKFAPPPAQPPIKNLDTAPMVPLRSSNFSGYGAMIPRTLAPSRPVPTNLAPVTTSVSVPATLPVSIPATLPAVSRSFTPVPVPVATSPRASISNVVPVTTVTASSPLPTVPVVSSAAPATLLTNVPGSTALTEYSIPRAMAATPPTSPRNFAVSSPVLPVVEGMPPALGSAPILQAKTVHSAS